MNNKSVTKYPHIDNLFWIIGISSIIFSFSFLAVPLYQLFCQQTGYGGTIVPPNLNNLYHDNHILDNSFNNFHKININFQTQIDPFLPILFEPKQNNLLITPGELTLTFYNSKNLTNDILNGISSYNVTPAKTAIYFIKIECFCLNEQQWKNSESIELPILFYIDPKILTDPNTSDVKNISICYTFFKSKLI